MRRTIRMVREHRIDIVYTNSIVTLSGALAAAVCRVPHVWHIRELLKGHPLKSPLPLPITFGLVGALSTKVITVSNAVAAQFSQRIMRQRVRVIYNGIDPAPFMSEQPIHRLRGELSLPSHTKLVGIIGSVQEHKNQAGVIRAFQTVSQRWDDSRLIIAGRQEPQYRKNLDELTSSLGLNGKVFFLGFRSDIPALMSELDVVVMASDAEPFGRITIEAMAAAKPVVAVNSGASGEIVVPGQTGYLVSMNNTGEMASAITDLLSDPEKASRMGQAGRKRVDEKFHIRRVAQEVQEVLQSVIQPKSKSPIVK